MSKSKNTNPNIFRSKWDLPHDLKTDFHRKNDKRVIQEQLEEPEMNSDEEIEEQDEI